MAILTYLYRCWDREGQLLYAGIANNVERRKAEHAADKFWWKDVVRVTTIAFERRIEAQWAEWAVISTCSPVYNRALIPPSVPDGLVDQPDPAPKVSILPGEIAPAVEGNQRPRDRIHQLVAENRELGIGPRAVYQALRDEGHPTTEQTVIEWMRADAAAGILAQPAGDRSPYIPGPRLMIGDLL